MKTKSWLLVLIISGLAVGGRAQPDPAGIQQAIASERWMDSLGIRFKKDVKAFYMASSWGAVWMQQDGEGRRKVLLDWLRSSAGYGLREEDYQFSFIQTIRDNNGRLPATMDSLVAEFLFTDAALHFLSDIVYGNSVPALSYTGLNYVPACFNIPAALLTGMVSTNLETLPAMLEPAMPEIVLIRSLIGRLQSQLEQPGYKEERIVSAKVNSENKPLCRKLFYLGLLDSLDHKWPDTLVKNRVKEAQRRFNVLSDGVLRSTALQELNVPLTARLRQLSLSLNYYRWLNCLTRDQRVIVVNLPAAYLKVYYGGESILEMRMIVGKQSTPTPTLSSRVKEVILYPYWVVPPSIATKELLPRIRRNPGYIDANGYQVMNKQGKIIDPYSVNWAALSPSNFPYVIRQSTGCDNALGLLKLNFNNPFSVYLHDTPGKSLFQLQRRFFSHGCMRMQEPSAVGYMLLGKNRIAIDTLEEKGCLRNQSPITVPVEVQAPVIVWYNPAGADSTGRVVFYEDVYKKFRGM